MRAAWADVDRDTIDSVMTWVEEHRPRVLPPDWAPFNHPQMGAELANGGWYKSRDGIRCLWSVEVIEGKRWLHVSFSRAQTTPSYFDMRRVKDQFVGTDRKAIMVLPAAAEHYNYHPHCLHLYSPIDGDPLPDFRDADGAL